MKLVVTEKNIAAKKIADLLADGSAKADKVFDTPIYRFTWNGDEAVSVGLKGHILETEYADELTFDENEGEWRAVNEGELADYAPVPASLAKPPFKRARGFSDSSVKLGIWTMNVLPYLVYGPIRKLPKEKGIIRSLKNLAKKAEHIVIATDFDREGELIGSEALDIVLEANPHAQISRSRYSAITKDEIRHAFAPEHLVDLDVNLAQAGESRQQIDLIWGAVLTRYLTVAKFSGVGNPRSAGRVQTPTLALIVQRELERQAFVPEDYWVLKGLFRSDAQEFSGTHAIERFKDEAQAQAAYEAVRDASQARVMSVEKKTNKKPAPTPFNTTSLQAAAAAEGLSPARTMQIAESLDLASTVKMLSGNPAYAGYCKKLLAKSKLTPTRGKTETTDHPPIHPTGLATPDDLRADEWKLYNLIARRFLATLSDAAVVESTTAQLDVAAEPFIAKGDVLVKPGFREIYPYGLKKDEQLPALEEGALIDFLGADLQAKQTEPPKRYSLAKLIQEMERLGLGTKSTRHETIERLYSRNYIVNDPPEPTALGIAVIEALSKFAPHITSPDMTAELEGEMSSIAAGERVLDDVVIHSRDMLAEIMSELIPRKEEVGALLSEASAADSRIGACPRCGKDLQLKSSVKTKSSFIGCAGYPDCDVTYPVPDGKIETVDEPCAVCGCPQVKLIRFRSKPVVRCVDPDCPSNQEPEIAIGACPVCLEAGRAGGMLIARRNPRTLKRSATCTHFDECGTRYPLPKDGRIEPTSENCPECGAPLITVTTRRGPWKICPNYVGCPSNQREEGETKSAKSAGRASTRKGSGSSKTAAKKAPAKKTTTRKTAAN